MGILLFSMQPVELAQEVGDETVEKSLSIFELILSGGLAGQVIIGALALMLAFAIYIYFERLFAIREALKVIPDFMSQIRDFVASGK